MSNDKYNRGRVQAQGKGLEESVSWTTPVPPTKTDAHGRLETLKGKLSRTEMRERERPFNKAHGFIDEAPKEGYDAPATRSFQPMPAQKDVRVDVELKKGKAFTD